MIPEKEIGAERLLFCCFLEKRWYYGADLNIDIGGGKVITLLVGMLLGGLFFWVVTKDRYRTVSGCLLGLVCSLMVAKFMGDALPRNEALTMKQDLQLLGTTSSEKPYYLIQTEGGLYSVYYDYYNSNTFYSTYDYHARVEYEEIDAPYVELKNSTVPFFTDDWLRLFSIDFEREYQLFVFHVPQGTVFVVQ